jgi:hypothetical protein
MPPKGDRLNKEQITDSKHLDRRKAPTGPGQMDKKLELKTDHWSFQPIVRPQLPSGSGIPSTPS